MKLVSQNRRVGSANLTGSQGFAENVASRAHAQARPIFGCSGFAARRPELRMTKTRTLFSLLSALLLLGFSAVDSRADEEGLNEALDALGITPSSEEEAAADLYSVVPGDTLWHICERFFGDPEYWPTLWSINNEEITNPHYIYPGQYLQFQPGTDLRPPSLLVAGDAAVSTRCLCHGGYLSYVGCFGSEQRQRG